MMNFQFEAFGQKLSFEGNDVNAAYVRANKFFAAVLDQGAWFDRDAGPGVLGFRWQVGNFFD
jgi:hypothetical protein